MEITRVRKNVSETFGNEICQVGFKTNIKNKHNNNRKGFLSTKKVIKHNNSLFIVTQEGLFSSLQTLSTVIYIGDFKNRQSSGFALDLYTYNSHSSGHGIIAHSYI